MRSTFLFIAIVLLAAGLGFQHFSGGDTRAAESPVATPDNAQSIVLGMGCFWGAEKRMAALPGVVDVMSGYAGGDFPDPTYETMLEAEGQPGVRNHVEVVKVVFDPAKTSLEQVLTAFWENHDPTQGDRQGNDIGSNYRSAIYFNSESQRKMAQMSRDAYQEVLKREGFPPITTEIAALDTFYPAEDSHQDYLAKNPRGYCGLGGTGVKFPSGMPLEQHAAKPLDPEELSDKLQLIVFEAEHCPFCELFRKEVLTGWKAQIPVATSLSPLAPEGWHLYDPLWATPTIVLFENGREKNRYTGYNGEKADFWRWLGNSTLTEEERQIAFRNGTEQPFTGSLLDNKKAGTYVDPVTGEALFRSDSKFESGTGWPSFFQPLEGAVTLHDDGSHGMDRVEVRSASSGIHLGHVFNDGPPPTGKRFCINSKVMRFIPD